MKKTVFASVLLFLISCHWFARPEAAYKMDARLRKAVASQDSLIQFSGKCNGTIDDATEQKLTETGITLRTIAGRHFTATGSADAVKKLANMKMVERLQAAKPMKPRH